MSVSDKVLVDTSAWIDFFRQKEPCHTIVQQLLAEQRVCTLGIIVAELTQGAKSEKELDVLRDFIHVFELLREGAQTWQAAGELSFKLRRQGKTVGLSDCFIAIAARDGDAEILTLDRHFELMREEAGVRLMPLGR